MKKHRFQMTENEVNRIEARVQELTPVLTPHAIEKGGEMPDLQRAKVVEFVVDYVAPRALMRDREGRCCVITLREGRVITIWRNHFDDYHLTLNIWQYDESLVIDW